MPRLYRRLISIAVTIAAVAGIVGVIPWSMPEGAFKADALRRVALTLGARELQAGDIRLALLPRPHITMSNVSFHLADKAAIFAIPAAQIDLKIGPLLAGHAKPAGLSLTAPRIELTESPTNASGFRYFSERMIQSSEPLLNASPLNGLTRIAVDRGDISIRSLADGRIERYENVRLRLSLPHRDAPLSASASAIRNGEEIRFSFRGASPLAVANATLEKIDFSLWTPGIAVEFDGRGSLQGKMTLAGSLVLRTGAKAPPPFMGALSKMGIENLPPIELTGQFDFNDRGANLTGLKVSLGKDRFEGAATLRHDGARWNISSTLAGEKADLTALFSPLSRMRRPDSSWNPAPVETDPLVAANLDLRISADAVTIHNLTFGKVALALHTRANRIEVTVPDATFGKGRGRLRMLATTGTDGMDVKLTGALDSGDLGQVLTALTGAKRFSGTGSAQIAVDSSGRSMAEFVANADGRVSATLREGSLQGIDLRRIANRRPGKRPEVALYESIGGETPFETASLTSRIVKGAATPVEGRMQAGRLVGTLAGTVDFAQGLNSLVGSVVDIPSENYAAEPRPVIDFTITGPLLDPTIKPNVSALLNRM